jgi:hypothetical protein
MRRRNGEGPDADAVEASELCEPGGSQLVNATSESAHQVSALPSGLTEEEWLSVGRKLRADIVRKQWELGEW